jgi:glycosyltransferase involved in cell wall biosynthesis
MENIKLFTNIASHYRKSLWGKLLECTEVDIEFYFGSNEALGIKLINFEEEPFSKFSYRFNRLKNIWLSKYLVVWQLGVVKSCLFGSFDKAIFLGEAYCLSNWVAATICRLRNIEVVFWGHGFYGNEGRFKMFFRKTFYRLADKHLLYERRAKQLMIEEGFKSEDLYVVFNSLDYDKQKKLREKYQGVKKRKVFLELAEPELPVLIFIGRLTPEKKLDLLIKVANKINKGTVKLNVIIIGDGPKRAKLEELGEEGIEKKWIHFLGACYDEEKIAQYLSAADLCVSPGNIGLTAIHSLAYGTPVCTHGDMNNQAPEAGAIEEGYNGFFFRRGSVEDLKQKIESWVSKDIDRHSLQGQCYEVVDQYYNPDYQLSVFERLITGKKPRI